MAGDTDQRAYLLPPEHIVSIMKDSPIFEPIVKSGFKVIFPFTPTIQGIHAADWGPMGVTHTNYQYYSYQGSQSPQLNLSGPFFNQSQEEAKYYLACVHFFRMVTKMRFGRSDPYRGAPPPILKFNAFGDLMFKNIPVIIRSFNFEMPPAVDFIDIGIGKTTGGSTYFKQRVPTQSNLFVDMQAQYLPGATLDWNIEKFANGDLVRKGFI